MDTQTFSGNDSSDTPAPHHEYPSFGRQKKKWTTKRILLVVGVAIAVLAIAGAACWYFMLRKPAASTPQQAATSEKTPAVDTTPTMPEEEASQIQTFKSTKLNLEFSYRKDWTFKESSDKTQITLTSPSATYETADGSTQGVFTLKLRVGVPASMKTTINKAVAVKDSEVIGYANPTPEQRFYTNVSYGGKPGQFNFMMVTGSTALKSGTTFNGAVSLTDDSYLFAGGYGDDASDSLVFDDVPVTAMSSAAYDQAVDIIKSLRIF